MLVIEVKYDGTVGVVDVIEHEPVALQERSDGENARDVGSWQPQAMPPTASGVRVNADAGNVGERDLQLAFERPQLIPALYLESDAISV